MKLLKHRPLIRNAIPPWMLFDSSEMRLITEAVKRSISLGRYGTKPKVAEHEIEAVRKLFDKAAFNGYLHNGIDDKGNVKWAVICEPKSQKLKEYMVITTIKSCEECGKKFHAKHYAKFHPKYPGTESPPDMCNRCEIKAMEKQKRLEAKEQVPF